MIFNRSVKHFVTLVLAPLILAAGGTVWLTSDLVGRVSTGANQQDHQRTNEIVRSAIAAAGQQLANVAADNANWDDAAVNAFAPQIDHEFVSAAWGDPSASGVNYDATFIVTAGSAPLVTYLKGLRRDDIDPRIYFSGQLLRLLKDLPQSTTDFESTSAIMSTADGPAIVAAANLVPTNPEIRLPSDEPRFLVFAKFMSPEFVSDLGDKFVVEGLSIIPPGEARSSNYLLTNQFGDKLGALTWRDRRPGDLARTAVLPKAYLMLTLLIGVMIAIALISWRQFRSIAQRELQAQHDAKHDRLTGLPNRVALMEELDAALAKAGNPVCATFVDLDGFKDVNDTYDHDTGDRLIMAVAAGFRVLSGGDGLVCRLGGDEFVILLHGLGCRERAITLAGQVIDFLAKPFDIDGRMAVVGGSIGIASGEGGTVSSSELMRRADIAMYGAKASGKNRHCEFHPDMDSARNEAAAIVSDLRAILNEDRLEVVYQPIINAASLSMSGVEALARWPSDCARHVGPDVFIPIAESAGLIGRLGKAVLGKACRDAKDWGDLRLSVNVSPVQLRDPSFVQDYLQIIDAHAIDRRRIELEVTEGTMIDDVARLQPIFEELRKAGLSLALDDFGSGYSSIAYLRELVFDRIKIDRSLTKSLLTSEMARNVVQATGLIASGISAAVTAEGVETGDELQLLRLAGCSEFQGYFFGRPQSAFAISAAMSQGATIRAVA